MHSCAFNRKILMIVLLSTFIGYAQKETDSIKPKDIREIYERSRFNKKKTFDADKNKKVSFSLLPAATQDGGKLNLVISFVTAFYLGDHENTKLSEISFGPTVNFTNQQFDPTFTPLKTSLILLGTIDI